jgi:tyrosine-protein kinase Etk/Wzc
VKAVNQQIVLLNRDMGTIGAKIKRLPEIEQDVVRLSRDVQVNREVYTAVLSTARQLRLATANKGGNVRLLDGAEIPVRPIKPNPPLIVMLAALGGLALGVIVTLMKKNIGGRVDDPDDVEKLLGLNVCATIPHSETPTRLFARPLSGRRELALISQKTTSNTVIESLLRFHTSLPLAMTGASNNIIMISGPTPGVGKSFVAANFATVLGSMGKKVLLIDADMRTGHLHRYFRVDRKNGLSDVIAQDDLSDQMINREVAENVDFISTGDYPERPMHLLAHANFEKLLKRLSARYDLVLIDTAPVLAVSDALTIGRHAGAVFNIVRGGVSSVWEIEETIKRFAQAGIYVTGTVFNDLQSRSSRYGYGYRNGYNTSYG